MKVSMNLGMLALAAVVALSLCAVARAGDGTATTQPAGSAAEIKALVNQLGDDSARNRDQAYERLKITGAAALPELRLAAQSKDPEVASRAKQLLEIIPKGLLDQCLLWKSPLPGGGIQSLLLSKDLAIFVGGDSKVHAFELAGGKPKWEYDPGVVGADYVLRLAGDKVIVMSIGHFAPRAISLAKGELLWQSKADAAPTYELVGETVVCNDQKNSIVGYSVKDGKEAYKVAITDVVKEVTTPHLQRIVSAGDITLAFVVHGKGGMGNCAVVALKGDSGQRIGYVSQEGGWVVSATVAGGKVYFVTLNNATSQYALKIMDLKSGKEEESRIKLDPAKTACPLALKVAEGKLLCVTTGCIVAYDLKEGKQAWACETLAAGQGVGFAGGIGIGGGPMPVMRPGIVGVGYAGGLDSRLAISDGQMIMLTPDGLTAVDMKTGKTLWTYPMDRPLTAGPLVQDGKVYFASAALNVTGGQVQVVGPGGGVIIVKGGGLVINGNVVVVNGQVNGNGNQAGEPACLRALDLSKARQLDPSPTTQPAQQPAVGPGNVKAIPVQVGVPMPVIAPGNEVPVQPMPATRPA